MTTDNVRLLTPEEVSAAQAVIARLVGELRRVVLGKENTIDEVVVALLARGHVLLEGLPGLGKTELVKALSRLLSLDFRRIQFTPDLLPTDITGSHILQERDGRKEFTFHPGPVFTNLLLADEINRASPKTQSALLEAMQERRVTIFGETRPLPLPFFVLATQNPIELEGTYPLPEAQLDRFMFKVDVSGVGRDVLEEILVTRVHGEAPLLTPVLDAAELQRLFDAVDAVHMPRAVAGYAARVVAATHPHASEAPASVRQFVKYGSSPRGAIAIGAAARGLAIMRGKPNVGFDEIRIVAPAALSHRLVLDYSARLEAPEAMTGRRLIGAVLDEVPEVERGLPQTLEART
jgi:MoxR-like ATPase